MVATAHNSWRIRRRWLAALALWFVIAYPISVGPAHYCVGRGWLPVRVLKAYSPLVWLLPGEPGDGSGFEFMNGFNDYNARWWALGERHGRVGE
jgi:hypothetical protein